MDLWWLTRVLFYILHARLWVRWAPGIPHALCWAEDKCTPRAHRAAGMRNCISTSLRGAVATKQSSFLRAKLDCFASLAMTVFQPIGCLKTELARSLPLGLQWGFSLILRSGVFAASRRMAAWT